MLTRYTTATSVYNSLRQCVYLTESLLTLDAGPENATAHPENVHPFSIMVGTDLLEP